MDDDIDGPSPPLNSTDDRNLRTRNRVRKKPLQRRVNGNENFYPNPPRFQGGGGGNGGRRPRNMNGDMGPMHGPEMPVYQGGQGGGMPQENGPMETEEESNLIMQCLSALPEPKVTDVDARSAKVKLSPPECGESMEIYPSDLKYELFLSDSGRDKKYDSVFCGNATDINLKVLTPATEYFLKVCAILQEELKGSLTEPVSFRTSACEPDTPPHPELVSKTRTSLSLKWNGTTENGSKITAYCLESDQGSGEDHFTEVYSGVQRRHKVSGLSTSSRYVFRLAAVNALGKSHYSQSVAFYTSGSVPSQPEPPKMSDKSVYSLTISWNKRPNDDEFLLQMEDDTTGHGFLPVYNGPNLCYKVNNLRRNDEYKFRLCAKNDEGSSKWSETVSFRTRPDRPHCPGKPQIKGKIHSHSFKITWDPPSDTGGMEINKYIVELDDGQGYEVVYEGSAREHQFDTLLPGQSYRVRVMCFSAGGRSEFSDCCVATTLPVIPGQCPAPKLQGKPKATSLHLRWGYPDYDGGSQVTAFAVEMISPDNTTREVYKGHDLDCIVAGLLPGRPYLFQIRAFNRAGAGLWSELLEVVSGAGVPDSPKPPKVTSRSSHNAVVQWEEPFNNGANITEYRLEWQQKSDSAEFTQIHMGPSMNYECKGMSPATFYAFRVQAINSSGPSPFSPATHYSSPASSPAAMLSVKCQTTAHTALLSWRQPHDNGSHILSYNISVNDKPPIFVDPVNEYLLEELKPETSYRVRIQAVNSIGAGPYSSPIKVVTKALPPSPPRLECVLLLSNSIKLKWGEGRPTDLLTYTLEMERDDGSFQPVYFGPAHTHKVNRLSELKTFEFRIFASNDAGKGPYSDTYSFTTTKAPPPALKAPKVQSKSSTNVILEWQGVKPMGSDSISYILQLMTCGGRNSEYKQIYKGPNTSFQYDFQTNHTEYQARVAAIRISSDSSSSSSGTNAAITSTTGNATACTTSNNATTTTATTTAGSTNSNNKNNVITTTSNGDIIGAFSPGTGFSRKSTESNNKSSSSDSGSGHSRERHAVERKPWTDQQRALAFVLVFSLLAIVIAFICQMVVSTYFSTGSASSPDSGSQPPPSSSQSPPHSSSIP